MNLMVQFGLDPETKQLLQAILTEGENMTQAMQNLTDEVASFKTVVQGATKALNGVGALIEAHKEDPVALQAIADDLKGQENSLAAAVALVDPPAPTPVP